MPTDMGRIKHQTLAVLILAAFFGIWKYTIGSPNFFEHHLSHLVEADVQRISAYAYHFGTEFIVGFVLPVLILTLIFKRRPRDIGLGLGDVKFALMAVALYIPFVTTGCWFLSKQPSFYNHYPMLDAAAGSLKIFIAYEIMFLLYWIGWEYLWRGFLLFGVAPTFGRWSIVIQMLPFAALHAQKPMAEAYLSIPGALLLGALVWRCRSFWIAVPIHAYQMFAMDFFCMLHRGLK